MFNIKQHNSGEVEVTLMERIRENSVIIKWNYFEQKDIMVPLLQAAAVKHTYGDNIDIILEAPYLPYACQDRIFKAGQAIAFEEFINIIKLYFNQVITMALHCSYNFIGLENKRYNAITLQSEYNIIFPDESARKHYYYPDDKMYTFIKERNENGEPNLTLDITKVPMRQSAEKVFLICDDIGDGNRTFVNCANALRREFPRHEIKIELMLYHAFCTYGLQNLFDAGITKLKIINPDSYSFLINKFPEHKDFFELITFRGNK